MFKFPLFKYLILINTFFLFQIPSAVGLDETNTYKSSSKINLEKYEDKKINYILDTGDIVFIEFKGLSLYTRAYSIDMNGYVDLPELNLVLAKDKTIPELQKLLLEKYSKFIFSPNIQISLQKPRPISVTLRGEVNNTGLFTLYHKTNPIKANNVVGPLQREYNNLDSNIQYLTPKLFDLIIQGNGITSNADLSKIIIIRKNPNINGGGKLKSVLNLFSLIENGDQTQNIELRDGDDIFVSKSSTILIDQLIAINSSNLTPLEIGIFINGNVQSGGAVRVPSGISLFEAIAASGEKNSNGNVEFIRLKKKGKTEKRIIPFNKQGVKGSPNNPILVNGDIIYVRKNILGQTSQVLKEYGSPVIKSYGLYKIFN